MGVHGQAGWTVHEDSGAHRVTTPCLNMEVEVVTHAIQWLASQRDAQITHAVILTDSMNPLEKLESGMSYRDWHTAMQCLRLQTLLWIYRPGHAVFCGNERTDRLAITADITSGLYLGEAEVPRGLNNILNMDRQEHDNIDRLREGQVYKKNNKNKQTNKQTNPSPPPPPSKKANIVPSEVGNDLCLIRQTWHCLEGHLGETVERRGEGGRGVWAFLWAMMPS